MKSRRYRLQTECETCGCTKCECHLDADHAGNNRAKARHDAEVSLTTTGSLDITGTGWTPEPEENQEAADWLASHTGVFATL